MKAAIHEKYGPPDVIKVKDVKKPTYKDNEVLIKVHAATVNRTDCAMLRAKPFIMRLLTGLLKPRNPTLGTDFAGKIEAIGKEVTSFNVGDRVFGFNDNGIGSHAQYMTLPERSALAIIPDTIPYEQAAASPEGAHYAYNFINKVSLKNGQKILVNGATGAIGSATVQLLKQFEAKVTAVCKGQNSELVKSIGAEKVIDYTTEDFTESAEKYDYVFDTVGKSTFGKCKTLLVSGGAYISSELGPKAQNPFLAITTSIIGKKKVKFPFPTNLKGSVHSIKKLLEQGKFKAVIDRRYSLEEIADAFRYVEKGQKIGNVVITMEKEAISDN